MIRGALKNPYLIVVVALGTAVLGVVSYQKIPADLLPIFETPAVQVVTFYPGMPPEVMERDIMSRLERWTAQSVGIEHQEAKAMLGVSVVKDCFREDVSMESAMSQVTSYAVSDMFYLPPGTIPPMVMPFDPTASVPLCLVSVSSTEMNEKELYDIAYFELTGARLPSTSMPKPSHCGGYSLPPCATVAILWLKACGFPRISNSPIAILTRSGKHDESRRCENAWEQFQGL